ncbi:MAG: hypothetical protein Q9217_000759 [Psora testacea]
MAGFPNSSPYQQSPTNENSFIPQYAEPPASPRAPLPPGFYPTTDPSLQQTSVQQTQQTQRSSHTNGDQNKNRLRKACDSCSIRKVKCDESGPPCKACEGLEIPCTFDRPSKRRGPPNRLAESIKKQRLESPGNSGHSMPSSPTHAAHTLASFAQQQVLSADAICPWPVLQLLIEDYFTFIHPLIPVPHEPSFRSALEHRQDLTSPTFLALMASMIGCLTASFPRRPRHHFKTHGLEHMYPTSMSLIDRCQKVAVEAHGPATYNRVYTVHDAIISYLQGLTHMYTFHKQPAMLYFKECLSIITTLGLHKADQQKTGTNGVPPPRMTANGHHLEGPRPPGNDVIVQELGRRVFWVLFVGIKSLQQLGVSPFEVNIPPSTRSDPYPPLPMEVDDVYLAPTHVLQQPEGHKSELVGFNINVRVFLTYQAVSTNELVHGVDELFDWERQKKELERSLENVKRILESLPPSLGLAQKDQTLTTEKHNYPEPEAATPRQMDQTNTAVSSIEDRRSMQQEIQKANIHASQLGTRSYLVEKYFNLVDAHYHVPSHHISHNSSSNAIAPSLNAQSPAGTNSKPKPSSSEVAMSKERESVIKDLLLMLSTIDQVHMEPNGASLISKVRAIASTLLDVPRTRKGSLALRAEDYLNKFVHVLNLLEKTVPANATPHEEDEESQLRGWADLREEQARFLRVGGFLG